MAWSSVIFMDGVDELGAAGLLAASARSVRRRRLAEVEDLEILAAWAGLHSSDPTTSPEGARARKIGNVLVQLGGAGTPMVQDHSLGEIALARGGTATSTRNALADVLDLIHRMPRIWRVCQSGTAEVWIGRRVARLSRHLPVEVMAVVDEAVARVLDREAPGRVLAVADAKIIEADPALHEQRAADERARRYVTLTQTDEHGLRTLIARLEAGDAAWIDATVTRVAELIAAQHQDKPADEIRALALGYLARPAELLQLLVSSEEPTASGIAESSRATAFPAHLLEALAKCDVTPLAPKATLYVHLHQAALAGHDAVARAEGLGPVHTSRLSDLLAGRKLTVRPVLDLNDRVRTTAYELPESLKERVHLITGGDYWPYAPSTSRSADYDHPTPYDATGPPGQTGTHNSGPLTRRHHRWKTHAGYQSTQSGTGRFVWTTPHGLTFLVDHTGTRPIDRDVARAIHEAAPGLDLYPGQPVPQ